MGMYFNEVPGAQYQLIVHPTTSTIQQQAKESIVLPMILRENEFATYGYFSVYNYGTAEATITIKLSKVKPAPSTPDYIIIACAIIIPVVAIIAASIILYVVFSKNKKYDTL